MRRFISAFFGVFFVSAALIAADFPAPQKLPALKDFPEPLVLQDGSKVASAEDWKTKRRPELTALFQHYMYGRYPDVKTKISAKVLFEDVKAFDGLAVLREVEVSLGIEKCPPFYVLIAIPHQRAKAGAPIFVGLNFSGNHTLIADERVHVPTSWMYPQYAGVKNNKATAEGRGKIPNTWPIDAIVKAGYAVATVYNGDFDPDTKDSRNGMRPWITPFPAGKVEGDFPATVVCWAWGVHRLIDYVSTVSEVDTKRIAAVGHSRLGKTALLAAALDERIAVAFPHQAGCGGTAPSRQNDPKAESVKRITTSFPHWFCGNFSAFADDTTKLPFDQHCLLAMCAPRPVLYSNASEDLWANPSGQFDMLRRATPVYELLGKKGVEAEQRPEIGKLLDSRLGYWIREGKHEQNRDDWKTFIAFADRWLK